MVKRCGVGGRKVERSCVEVEDGMVVAVVALVLYTPFSLFGGDVVRIGGEGSFPSSLCTWGVPPLFYLFCLFRLSSSPS